MSERIYEPKGVTNGMDKTEQELIKQLKETDPELRLQVAVNLARAGHINIVGQSGIPGLFDAVKAAIIQNGNLSHDATRTTAVNIGSLDMEQEVNK